MVLECCGRFCLEALRDPFEHGCFKTEVKHAQNATTTTTNKGSMSISATNKISQVCCQSPKRRCLHCSTSSDWSSERSAHDSNPPVERFGSEGNMPNLPGLCILKRVSRFRAMFDVFLWTLAKLWYMDLTLLLLRWKYGFISVYAALCTRSLHAIPTELRPSNLKWKLNMIQTETDIHHASSYILHSLVFGFFILNLIVHTLIKVPARASVNAFLRIAGLDTEHFKNLKISSPTSTPRDEACLPNGCLLALGETQIGRNLGLNHWILKEEIATKEKQFATLKLPCWSCAMVQDFMQAFHPKTFMPLIHTIWLQRRATKKSTILTPYPSNVDSNMQPAQRNKPMIPCGHGILTN